MHLFGWLLHAILYRFPPAIPPFLFGLAVWVVKDAHRNPLFRQSSWFGNRLQLMFAYVFLWWTFSAVCFTVWKEELPRLLLEEWIPLVWEDRPAWLQWDLSPAHLALVEEVLSWFPAATAVAAGFGFVFADAIDRCCGRFCCRCCRKCSSPRYWSKKNRAAVVTALEGGGANARQTAAKQSSKVKIKHLGKGKARQRGYKTKKQQKKQRIAAAQAAFGPKAAGYIEEEVEVKGGDAVALGFGNSAFGETLMKRAAKRLGPEAIRARMGKRKDVVDVKEQPADLVSLFAAAGADITQRAQEEMDADDALDVEEGIAYGGLPKAKKKEETEVFSRVPVWEPPPKPKIYALT